MGTYSQDLRLRVLSAVDGGMSKMQAHRTFRVSRSTIDDWLKRRAVTGSVAATTHYRHGPARAISDLAAFERFAWRHSGATLGQLAQAWQAQTGQQLSINTFSLTLQRLGWTRKKELSLRRAQRRQTCRLCPTLSACCPLEAGLCG